MANVRGIRNTNGFNPARIKIEMANEIFELNKSQNPFTLLLSKYKKMTVENKKFEWGENDLLASSGLTPVAIAPGDTVITPQDDSGNANTTIFRKYDLIRFTIGGTSFSDVMLVVDHDDTAVPNPTITVQRAVTSLNGEGGLGAVNVPLGSPFSIIGNAYEEGSRSGEIISREIDNYYNYVQNFKKTVGVTGRTDVTAMYGENDLDYQKKQRGIEHAFDIEKAFLFGQRGRFAGPNGKEITTTRGLWNFIPNSVTAGIATGGEISEDEWELFAKALFKYNYKETGNVKTVFGGSILATALDKFAKRYLTIKQDESTYGLEIAQYKSPFGKINIVYHPKVFDLPAYSNLAVGVDFGSLSYMTLKGRDTRYEPNLQENDEDAKKGQWFTDSGIRVTNAEVNCKLVIAP